MKRLKPQRIFYLTAILLGCFLAARAQQAVTVQAPPPAPSPSAAPIPTPVPDQRAYDEARRIKDPQKKIEALEKVIKDYPERFSAYQARNDVLDVLIKAS